MLSSHTLQFPLLPKPPNSNKNLNFFIHCSLNNGSSSSSYSSTATTINNFNHLIQSLCSNGQFNRALQLLPREPSPTQRTLESLLLACNSPTAAAVLREHVSTSDPFLSTRLIELYSRLGLPGHAREVFDETPNRTIFVYNALLKALLLADSAEDVIAVCRELSSLSGIQMDSFSYAYVLKGCLASCAECAWAFGRVRQIHAHVLRRGFESNIHVATTLVDAYGKLGRVLSAERVFDRMTEKNVVSWSAMVACYAKNKRPFDALQMFYDMVEREPDALPNSVTMVSVLQACAGLAAPGQGKLIHGYVIRKGLDSIVSVINALIAMYAKCGMLDTARRVFNYMNSQRDVVSWNSMISAYGLHGHSFEAIHLFEEMIRKGTSPSAVTFISILGACSHKGLVQEGKRLFDSMFKHYNLIPSSEHYACMVDLLGRAGKLDEAAKIVEEMRIEPGPSVWGSLLGACRIHSNVELAERVSVHLFELEPLNAGNYVLLADIYSGAKMWEDVNRVKKMLEARGLQKVPGCSWIEVKKKVYSFTTIDGLNPQIEQLHALLVKLVREMKEAGYVPDTRVVLYELDQVEKEQILLGHSEKLALAFGLINTCNREVIRITKNLRLCEDCHSVTKFVSKFAKRDIFVRDVNRFHHFKDGVCSCNDYW